MTNRHEEGLVGPRSDERGEREEDRTTDGKPLWMAFLADPDAPHVSNDETEHAKNALEEARAHRPEIITICKLKTIKECRSIINPAEAA